MSGIPKYYWNPNFCLFKDDGKTGDSLMKTSEVEPILDAQSKEIKQEKSATLHLISVVELRGDDLVEAKREIKRLRDFLTDLHGSIADDGAAQKIAEALKSNTEAEHD